MKPNRNSGKWLNNRKACPLTALPCGNPIDADEAMRAGQIEAGSNSFLARQQAEQAMNSALKIAKNCPIRNGQCPLEIQFGKERSSVLHLLKQLVQ